MTTRDVTGRDLAACIETLLLEKYGPPRVAKYPDGLRLEIHSRVYFLLMQDPSLDWHFSTLGADPQGELAQKFNVPVRVNDTLPAGSWRLVIVTEETLIGGVL